MSVTVSTCPFSNRNAVPLRGGMIVSFTDDALAAHERAFPAGGNLPTTILPRLADFSMPAQHRIDRSCKSFISVQNGLAQAFIASAAAQLFELVMQIEDH